jgi:quinol monooxygenase YgiN
MFYINVWLTVRDPQDVPRVRDLLARCVSGSRVEQGCARYEVYHSQADPCRFLLIEHWQTKADWEYHRTQKAFQEIYEPQVLPLVTREPHVSTLVEELKS